MTAALESAMANETKHPCLLIGAGNRQPLTCKTHAATGCYNTLAATIRGAKLNLKSKTVSCGGGYA